MSWSNYCHTCAHYDGNFNCANCSPMERLRREKDKEIDRLKAALVRLREELTKRGLKTENELDWF